MFRVILERSEESRFLPSLSVSGGVTDTRPRSSAGEGQPRRDSATMACAQGFRADEVGGVEAFGAPVEMSARRSRHAPRGGTDS